MCKNCTRQNAEVLASPVTHPPPLRGPGEMPAVLQKKGNLGQSEKGEKDGHSHKLC